MPETILPIALVDDHKLFRKGLISLIDMVDLRYRLLFEADNGLDMQKKIDRDDLPELILMDVNMPGMDGFESVQWLKKQHPEVKVLVVSMIQDELSIMRMLKLGVKGYLSKDVEPLELQNAIRAVISRGFYYTDYITGKLVHSLQVQEDMLGNETLNSLSVKERQFIQLACSELTYNDIASEMHLSPKTIDGYRLSVFEKLKVKTRVGLAIYAMKQGLVAL
jgi:two-component system, NarL family, invasion response regulator UvrY